MDGSSIFGCFLIFFFFSASCVSLVPETPPTALILEVPSGESSPFLPQDPSPSADVVTGVTLKAPQVGLPSRVLFLNYGSQSMALTRSILITWELVRNACLQAHPRITESGTLEVGPRNLCFDKPSRGFGCP